MIPFTHRSEERPQGRSSLISRDRPILVVGSTGELGGAVSRKLLAAGVPVRAFGRNRTKLDYLRSLGAQVVEGDLLDSRCVLRACDGVKQIFTSANNALGHGSTSPNRVDLPAHRNLCEAARQTGVGRLLYVSGRGPNATCAVDFFRLKHRIGLLVQDSGVPYVVFCPTVFMETWAGRLLGDTIRRTGVAVLFGDGKRVSNFIAIDDVADFAVRILQDESIRNEIIEVGGPSNMSFADVATCVERELKITAKRRLIPVPVLRLGAIVLRPFSEVKARMMAMAHFTATRDGSFDDWHASAERFGVSPVTVQTFLARWFGKKPDM